MRASQDRYVAAATSPIDRLKRQANVDGRPIHVDITDRTRPPTLEESQREAFNRKAGFRLNKDSRVIMTVAPWAIARDALGNIRYDSDGHARYGNAITFSYELAEVTTYPNVSVGGGTGGAAVGLGTPYRSSPGFVTTGAIYNDKSLSQLADYAARQRVIQAERLLSDAEVSRLQGNVEALATTGSFVPFFDFVDQGRQGNYGWSALALASDVVPVGKVFGVAKSAGGMVLRSTLKHVDKLRPVVSQLDNLKGVRRVDSIGGPSKAANRATGQRLVSGEGQVGAYDDLIAAGTKGDNLTPHHVPSASHMAGQGVSRGQGVAINMEHPFPGVGGRHRMTFTYGTNADAAMSSRQALGAGSVILGASISRRGFMMPMFDNSYKS